MRPGPTQAAAPESWCMSSSSTLCMTRCLRDADWSRRLASGRGRWHPHLEWFMAQWGARSGGGPAWGLGPERRAGTGGGRNAGGRTRARPAGGSPLGRRRALGSGRGLWGGGELTARGRLEVGEAGTDPGRCPRPLPPSAGRGPVHSLPHGDRRSTVLSARPYAEPRVTRTVEIHSKNNSSGRLVAYESSARVGARTDFLSHADPSREACTRALSRRQTGARSSGPFGHRHSRQRGGARLELRPRHGAPTPAEPVPGVGPGPCGSVRTGRVACRWVPRHRAGRASLSQFHRRAD